MDTTGVMLAVTMAACAGMVFLLILIWYQQKVIDALKEDYLQVWRKINTIEHKVRNL